MKKKIRFFSLIMSLIMIFTVIPMNGISAMAVSAEDFTEPTIFVDSKYSAANSTVSVDISIVNNPGIAGATLTVKYDQYLTLTAAQNGEAFSKLSFTKPGTFANPSKFLWDSESGEATGDGTILTLTFDVSASAEPEANLSIELSSNTGDFYNEDMETVNLQLVNGNITVIDYIPGDVNDDGVINGKDVTLIRRHIVGGYNQTINESAANVNGDSTINGKDVTAIRRYIVGGYNIVLQPCPRVCNHQMEATEYKAASCEVDGNIAYWHCTACDKYFKDAVGAEEISLENTVIPATGHTVVIDPAVAATETSTGLTEGSHCSVCHKVIVEQEETPMLEVEQYSIIYNIANGDEYIAAQNINNPNPDYYTSTGLTLKNISCPGYNFLGWYDLPSGTSAENVKKIDAGSKDTIELYAHWEEISYTINFDCGDAPLVEVPSQTYTTSQGATLVVPSLDGYTFMGWSDSENRIVKNIPVGSVGNITLYANWTSKRNQTRPVSKIEDPYILEDSENGTILFAYEIGQIENVPLYEIERYVNAAGATTILSTTKTSSISETNAKTIASTISKATTNSSSWSLSEDWNDVTSVDETYAQSIGLTQQEAETKSKTSEDNYSLNSSKGGTTTITDSSGISSSTKWQNSGSNTTSGGTETTSDWGVQYKNAETAGVEMGLSWPKVFEFDVNYEQTNEENTDSGYSEKAINNTTGTTGWSNEGGSSSTSSHVNSNSSSWNSSEGYSKSNSVSESVGTSKALSNIISNTKGYGCSYSSGGERSSDQSLASTDSMNNQYSNTFTYYTSDVTTTTTSTEITGSGYYRLVCAGTVHVFAVVGYDVATSTYFTYTYSILDDNTYEWIDYSKSTPNFNDNENGVLPLEVPFDIYDYVTSKTLKSDGLVVDITTGYITDYIGNDSLVVIPSYVSVNNHDGTYSSVKIMGIEADVFSGNTVLQGVVLGDYVKEIPDSAFEGCSSLQEVSCPGVTRIGANAFKGCSSLSEFTVTDNISYVGSNAFDGVNSVKFEAVNSSVAMAATTSGAKSVALDISSISEVASGLTFEVGEAFDYFELQGKDKTYEDIKIKSDAKVTVLNGLTIKDCTRIPLEISSENITLNRVNVTAPGYALLLSSENSNVLLYGTIIIVSESGNAVVCRDITLSQLNQNIAGKLSVTGNIYICGELTNENNLVISNGSVIHITEEEYANYIKGSFNLSFNANGGAVETASKIAYCGAAIGTLPTPTREQYTFAGWYTEQTGGTVVTSETICNTSSDVTLYAHWNVNSYTASWNGGTGYSITVNRTSSPNAGAATGTLSSGAKVYYGDVLSITYTKADYYNITSKGKTSITVTNNVTSSDIYASAALNAVSDWTKESNVPTGAQIIETKYSFTHRYYTNDSTSTKSGWTLYNTERTDWGSTQGPVYSDPSNGSRNVWSESYISGYNKKSVDVYFRYHPSTYYYYSARATGTYDGYYCNVYEEFRSDAYSITTSGSSYHANLSNGSWVVVYYSRTEQVDNTNSPIYSTRWYYQEPIYTYYFYQDKNEENSSKPSGSDYSNIVTWKKYRAK